MLRSLRGIQVFFWPLLPGRQEHETPPAPEIIDREPRYEVPIPLTYRLRGEGAWRAGAIENINLHGILLRCPKPLPEGSLVDVSFPLPAPGKAGRPWDVFFCAQVVWTRSRLTHGAPPGMAAKIISYRSATRPPEDVRAIVGEVRGPLREDSLEPCSMAGPLAICAMQGFGVLLALAQTLSPTAS